MESCSCWSLGTTRIAHQQESRKPRVVEDLFGDGEWRSLLPRCGSFVDAAQTESETVPRVRVNADQMFKGTSHVFRDISRDGTLSWVNWIRSAGEGIV
jgi:hypothetical protein